MLRGRVTAASAALLMVVVVTVGGALASTAAAATATQVSIAGKPKLAVYHDGAGGKTADVVRHRGALTTTDGAPVAGATVTLERKLASDADWTALGDKTTDANGKYTFYSYVAGNARYKVSFAGDATNAASESADVPLKAMRDFNAKVVEKNRFAVLKGNINPGWEHKVVHWEGRRCKTCAWGTIDKARAGSTGSWAFRAPYAPAGKKWYFRATIDGTEDFVKSYSATLTTTTKRARTTIGR